MLCGSFQNKGGLESKEVGTIYLVPPEPGACACPLTAMAAFRPYIFGFFLATGFFSPPLTGFFSPPLRLISAK